MTSRSHRQSPRTQITRRAFAGIAGATAAGALVLPHASAAPIIRFAQTSRAQDEQPKSGGTLRYGLSTDPSNFEPHFSTGAASTSVKAHVLQHAPDVRPRQ
ncbi:MAG TPA: hypothetical protein VNZ58_06240, partial [Thermomicrobiales bacterium]|nr:hypothetical protein [Thermomicrobiales bacterium]